MDIKEWKAIHEYCMNKPAAYESRPFGEWPICYRVAGKIFAQLTPKEEWYKITLKTNPEMAEVYRSIYKDVVVRGYHCPASQQPYWNTIDLNRFELDKLLDMIDEAYSEVVKKLTKKEQKRLPQVAKCQFVKTDWTNTDFQGLCAKLDQFLDEVTGGVADRSKYRPHNKIEKVQDVYVIYLDGVAVGSGCYRFYDEERIEMKRIFVDSTARGLGLGKELMRRLEADARIKGFRYAILETGDILKEATHLYKRMGYKVIPNYGPYVDMPESLCMQKKL